ncbi:ABC transporter permease [Halorubrum lacusprofundi]|jgi:simple sugar transport system permease protein|uniref:Inner-membrane translocator n=1 Tax=Halorubrum lacusprofundi (strain ATCC 49239 / DSM 5036 / JCM 8891 / ACAM 34) TaxID=416348 RepID=B9LNR4_HALLT|nr:ABC transporter permease [Halorubrum lacusprofundi]ACM57002.1 inner-membrane translocator [Halorubrum lacusprofundi ATCC 49239]MCG1006637.1 ABC transporter permease [Halorubrum lacusprofundi]
MHNPLADVPIPILDDLIESDYVRSLVVGTTAVLGLLGLLGLLLPGSIAGDLAGIVFSTSTAASTARLAAPIVLAGLGGIFAEKSGVINIGLEGLLIISAFVSVYVASVVGIGNAVLGVPAIWVGFLAGIAASTALSGVFGIVCIEFKADQIIAGLAVWLIALGLAPFMSTVFFGGVNTPNLGARIGWHYSATMVVIATLASWWALNRTAFGKHLRAAGENPKALDTVGISVSKVRHAGVLLSGVLSGVGGSALALSIGQFIGSGDTMVQGKGFIAIVAYLFGNYNPLGTLGAGVLFAGLDAIQIRLQQLGYAIPDTLVQTIPYVVVILVLALVGRTRLPEAAGEHYETED